MQNEIYMTIVHAAQNKYNYKWILRRNITELIKRKNKETVPSTGFPRFLERHVKSWNLKLKICRHGKSWKWTWVMESHGQVMEFKTHEKFYQFLIICDTVSLNGFIYKINYNNNNTVLYSSKLYNKISAVTIYWIVSISRFFKNIEILSISWFFAKRCCRYLSIFLRL